MDEFGIFNDEGLLESDFYSREAAEKRLAEEYAEEGAWVGVVCPTHREEEAEHCSECEAEDAEEEGASEDD
jgi:hypothetical protein